MVVFLLAPAKTVRKRYPQQEPDPCVRKWAPTRYQAVAAGDSAFHASQTVAVNVPHPRRWVQLRSRRTSKSHSTGSCRMGHTAESQSKPGVLTMSM